MKLPKTAIPETAALVIGLQLLFDHALK